MVTAILPALQPFYHKLSRAVRLVFVGFFVLSALSSCVRPPKVDTAQVIPAKELKLIATVKRGKDYTSAGRLDLAEYEYRKVIAAGVKNSSVFNDLGFVLQSFGRLKEAEATYRQALDYEPRNLVARDNLGRLMVLREDIADARKQFLRLLDDYNTFTKRELLETLGQDYGVSDLVGVYRNLSMLEYRDGNFDEAVCYSRRAYELNGDAVQTGQHARLLISLGLLPQALEILNKQSAAAPDNVPAKVLIDLMIVLYVTADYDQAGQVVESLINRADLIPYDRETTRLLKLLLISREASQNLATKGTKVNNSEDVLGSSQERETFDALAEEFPDMCKTYTVDPDDYWPDTLREEMRSQLKMLCQDDELVYPGRS